MEENVFFYYTNDLHSHFENWSKIVGHLKEKKVQHERKNESCWLIDNGDHLDRSNPITEAMLGKANVELLNDAHYDVVTIGNNEGITLGHSDLYHLYDDATFNVLCANLQNRRSMDQPSWLGQTYYVTSKHGLKIGFVGVTAPFFRLYKILGWDVFAPFDVLDEMIPKMKKEVDVIVLLSHLGLSDDETIARRYKDIDVIIGGHTHHLFLEGEYIGNTLMTAAGKFGNYIGEVHLTWDHSAKKLVHKKACATNISHSQRDIETVQKLKVFHSKATTLLSQTILTLDHDIDVNWFKDTEIMRHFAQTLLDWTNADVAMLNTGVLLEGLDKGDVTYGDVHRICPHPINPCKVEIKGDELLEVIRESRSKRFVEFELKGFGFRGKLLGRMAFAGLDVITKVHTDGNETVTDVLVDGKPLQPDQRYQVVTADTFTFGGLLPELARSKVKKYYMPEFLRDLLVKTLQDNY
ncbi:bifunctional metallophosphatase/5'-nucleotidase [Aquibacillus sp. 3ASR75-11]|uniref:Bifunctional metallophosphatase/5'-nucleotidase n=1 Tax=Terrihalobacillus insolitus TaxID=2950438 RepID=A0A9X3WTB1_9BACI|nr:bifunctional UDP-sugar hydrolase/5'-nucleotidase [Terrihalobacillus insolitus]MDC3412348.1 bifunctional metallophosphatase/5'-nucleotidase [Terrihalobacillus insolitus]MDC3422959.1 bifunctional metallophosphatase/5'-nucleotidase [Terrihalobacillus insolitus]